MNSKNQFSQKASFEEIKGENLKLKFYDGSTNKHWYWGNLAFDTGSFKMAKAKIGIFENHEPQKRIGVGSQLLTEDGSLILKGKFLQNDLAEQVRKDATEGFPFEASMSFDMDQAKIEYIQDGQETQINGLTLTGPGTVIKNTVVREVSICPFGALKNCETQVFSQTNLNLSKGKIPMEQDFMSMVFDWQINKKSSFIEALKKISELHPDRHQEFIASGKPASTMAQYLSKSGGDFMQVAEKLKDVKGISLTAAMREVAKDCPELHKDYLISRS